MRFRQLIMLFLFISLTAFQHSYAQEVIVKRSTVVENYKGKPCYMHFVNKGETLAAIAKAYNVTVEEISSENPFVNQGLKVDMVLRIPLKSAIVVPEADSKPKTDTKTEPAKPAEKPKEQSKPVGDPNYILYQVKKQETLYGISKQYNVSIDDIINANPGFDGLKDGMEIKIPKKKSADKVIIAVPAEKAIQVDTDTGEVVVKPGETLYSIGKAHNVTVDELIDLNPQLSEGLKAGMILKLRKTTAKSIPTPGIKNGQNIPFIKGVNGDCYNAANLKNTYKVALILPFLLADATAAIEAPEQKDPSDFASFNYFQFYAGFMLAADSLEKYGLHAQIQVLDGDKLNDTLTIRQTLRKPGMDKLDLMVGPMYANSFSVAARFARKNAIGIINPLSRRENIVEGNPFVIKSQVSSAGIALKLSSFIMHKYPNATIIAVRNDNKEYKTLINEFALEIKTGIASHSFKGNLQEVTYSKEMMAGLGKKLKSNTKNIIIFFSNNKTNVPNFVSLLNPLSKSNDILLMGMDGWEEFELETEFLVNLNFHQITSTFVDYDSEAVKQFTTRFRNKYGAEPLASKYAFLGYDTGWYFLTSLMKYGDKYISCLPDYSGTGLQYNFHFTGTKPGDGFQNQDVSIIKLQDYKMIKVE